MMALRAIWQFTDIIPNIWIEKQLLFNYINKLFH